MADKKKVSKKRSPKRSEVISLSGVVIETTILKMAQEIEKLKARQRETCEMAARSILQALDAKDHYTYGHSMRVAYFSLVMGREMGLSEEELYQLELAGLFHDIGKIGTPDKVLLKPTRLDEEEFLEMKKHPERSAQILEGFTSFETIAKCARHHHERFDGRGYPDGLKGEEIPLFSRILLIADTFDAMTSSRPYRKGLSMETAFSELQEFSGTQFDPNIVEVFIKGMNKELSKKEETFYLKIANESFKKDAA